MSQNKSGKKKSRRARPVEDKTHPAYKKALGQHFLREDAVLFDMMDSVTITAETTVVEIGCGDGFLTRAILEGTDCKKLICFEIDPEWASYVQKRIDDPRLDLRLLNVLDADWSDLEQEGDLVILANLPYQISFPILFKVQQHRKLFRQGVVMVQEEVAQKVVANYGRGYNQTALFLQHYFDWKLLRKIGPGAFVPPPKVDSRLIYFETKHDILQIPEADRFWPFLKSCFSQPRRKLRNNLKPYNVDLDAIVPAETLELRAQQMVMDDFLKLWSVWLKHTDQSVKDLS